MERAFPIMLRLLFYNVTGMTVMQPVIASKNQTLASLCTCVVLKRAFVASLDLQGSVPCLLRHSKGVNRDMLLMTMEGVKFVAWEGQHTVYSQRLPRAVQGCAEVY